MRLLIIENGGAEANYIAKAFREVGHGADLAAYALDGQYDALIVHRRLPKIDGLTRSLAPCAAKASRPVLILSALGQIDDRINALRAGGDDYLLSPIKSSLARCGDDGEGCPAPATSTNSP